MLCKCFLVVSKMVLNINIFQSTVSKLEIPILWQHYKIYKLPGSLYTLCLQIYQQIMT